MDKNAIQELIKLVSPELTWLLLQAFLALMSLSLMKSGVTGLINYLKLRASFWGLNTKMSINGKIAYIKHISFNEVEFFVNDKETMYVPVEVFLKSVKIVYHNGYTGDEN
jgi:hypothetical protein